MPKSVKTYYEQDQRYKPLAFDELNLQDNATFEFFSGFLPVLLCASNCV